MFQVLRKRSSGIASFVEHPAYKNYKMYSVLIFFFFFFQHFSPKSLFVKVIFSLNCQVQYERSSDIASFYCDLPLFTQVFCGKLIYFGRSGSSAKEAVIFFHLQSALYIVFSNVYTYFFISSWFIRNQPSDGKWPSTMQQ